MNTRGRRALTRLLAALPLLLLLAPLRQLLEGSMALHMLVELPLLLASGWAAGAVLAHHRLPAGLPRLIDASGVLGLAFASCVGALWMIPAMLDLSLLDTGVQWAKYGAWWLSGVLLRASWRRSEPEIAAFFIGNMAWMLATAGLLYQDEGQRLCVSYLVDEQAITGKGLIVLALVLAGLALHRVVATPANQPGERLAPGLEARTSGMTRR
ncbi:hypothetical protein CKCBHOJB_02445 [Thauera sp. GDN1]|uniref:hypothetical protein n=1 Tax=Thauera sp. GDN1 TaxID=2944810 RepID=UPI002478BA0B|nr:hypothetical protein [Thauera sp. GDN1]WEN42845.1 hypothetical protein CKCBHOJB_02445 [Thauera sp. GDN1]